ncbi:MAG: beta galactosidase jelly roll domain-containing protein, partial [Victivallales bacterium]|nr:beta galactosidase jelly roll domain-containing protein [Victivallales bacterium]
MGSKGTFDQLNEALTVQFDRLMNADNENIDKEIKRSNAVSQLAADKPAKGKQLEILEKTARKEKNAAVRDIASKAIWPFYRNTVLLRNRSDWDHDVKVVQDILLPAADWRFSLDEKNQGHLNNWFKTDFDDSAWKTIPIAVTWEDAGFKYDGLAWYRKSFKAPSKPEKFNAVELHFESVDECAWVWLNGIYIGQHDLGTSGWQTPFSLDITKEIKWDADNVIVVRILDTAGAGGIYKPVHLQILE